MSLIVASNRLPVVLRHGPDGVTLADSVGGVATGLRGLSLEGGMAWVGWPGPTEQLAPDELAQVAGGLEARGCVPVYLTRREVRGFYQGFANGVIWPLFHYLVQQLPLSPRHWEEYEAVNRRFAERIAGLWQPGQMVWVHDYQLLRVPHLLRQLCPAAPIGFFLHIPFPSLEIFRILPMRRLLLEGMLAADLVGFHTEAYAQYFGDALTRLLGAAQVGPSSYEHQGHRCEVGVFPMGIDPTQFEEAAGAGAGSARAALGGAPPVKTLLGIDRLDYTKGIPRRLLAFNQLLHHYPEFRERVSLVQVAVPSRTSVRAYRRFRRHVDAMVGRINGTYGTPGWTPVHYLYRGFTQGELIDFYRQADVMLVTPVRDGMNLVAKEFIASRTDMDGVLVLSEFAGAAAELEEALVVNPYDIVAAADTYRRALQMPRHERRARMRALRARVRANRVDHWAEHFLARLRAAYGAAQAETQESPHATLEDALGRIRGASSLLLLLDYDGTLVPYAPTPDDAPPDEELLALLDQLARAPGTSVQVVSGRARGVLEGWLGDLPVGLHAEHGTWSRLAGGEWERHEGIRPVPYDALLTRLKELTRRTPGSLIERKSASLAWHFRLANREEGRRHADQLVEEVRQQYPDGRVDVLRGEQVVEFRPGGLRKELIVRRLAEKIAPDLVMALGDDGSDEEIFAAIGERGISVQVGPRPSGARLQVRDVAACRALLREVARAREQSAQRS